MDEDEMKMRPAMLKLESEGAVILENVTQDEQDECSFSKCLQLPNRLNCLNNSAKSGVCNHFLDFQDYRFFSLAKIFS